VWRELFSYSLNPEVFFDAINLWNKLGGATWQASSIVRKRNAAETRRLTEVRWASLARCLTEEQRTIGAAFLMEQSAPMAAALGTALHGLSAPGVFELPEHLCAMALLADDVGVGAAQRSRADAFRAIAVRYGIENASVTPQELSNDRRVNDQMFRLPGTLLALSRRSDYFSTELIAADLVLREIGCLVPWSFAAKALISSDWSRLNMASAQMTDSLPQGQTPLDLSRMIARTVAELPGQKERLNSFTDFILELYVHDLTVARLDARLSMALLLQAKAREASVYHANFKLKGRTLRDWFSEAQADPLPLLNALAESRIIEKGSPDRSRLTTQMLDFGGPMFRVFKECEIKIIRDWITDLGREDAWFLSENRTKVLNRLSSTFVKPRPDIGQGAATMGITPTSVRQAYFTLQGRALAPATQAFALEYCDFWLAKAAACVDKTERSLPTQWQPGLMREWLLKAHDHNAKRYEGNTQSTIPSREQVIEQSLQLAPLTLIDGAWLQGYSDVSLASSRIGAALFKTYWDELGNGSWEKNHPKIYRDVLSAMGKELPPTGSLEFAFCPDLDDESFKLPVFWLAIGKFPMSYRNEILGLNLAMELSGVGGAYRAAHRFLKHYDFPTIFVDLHNTIDNVSDGHAAWAVDAIDLHISASESPREAASAWAQIRIGYEALDPIISICGSLSYFRTQQSRADFTLSATEALHHVELRRIA
jgi:Iron-containing redox enzyme